MLRGFLVLAFVPALAHAQIYADFETGSGSFSIELNHLQSPQAAANLIRLIEGTAAWADPVTGEVFTGTPFYDGLSFHGTNPGMAVAFGSRSPSRDDDPGWVFQDDSRSIGNSFYSVYLDNRDARNALRPNHNGSRLLISLPILSVEIQQYYTHVGKVVAGTLPPGGDGRATIHTISYQPAGSVEITSASIRRVGLAANQFDENNQGLGEIGAAQLELRRDDGELVLGWRNPASSLCRFWQSTDLVSWPTSFESFNAPGRAPGGYRLDESFIAAHPGAFFRGSRATYPVWPSVLRSLNRATIQTQFRDPNDGPVPQVTQIQFHFTPAGDGGLWMVTGGASGTFDVADFSPQGPFAANLTVVSTTLPSYRFLLHYDRDGLTGLTKQVGRLDGVNLSSPSETNRLYEGTWIYLAGP